MIMLLLLSYNQSNTLNRSVCQAGGGGEIEIGGPVQDDHLVSNLPQGRNAANFVCEIYQVLCRLSVRLVSS